MALDLGAMLGLISSRMSTGGRSRLLEALDLDQIVRAGGPGEGVDVGLLETVGPGAVAVVAVLDLSRPVAPIT